MRSRLEAESAPAATRRQLQIGQRILVRPAFGTDKINGLAVSRTAAPSRTSPAMQPQRGAPAPGHSEARPCWPPSRTPSCEPDRFRCYARRSEEHTSELQSLMRISYAVFCLQQKQTQSYTYRNH